MNILELDSYNLADAVKFHDRLNHRLWDSSEHLHPKVHAKLMEIAQDFQEFLGVPDLDVKDITVSGSNAAYNYTPNSDIDLHLVVDLPEADSSEVYRELFDAKKFQYNAQHNITIGGYDVELYVQNPNQEHHSQGIYSLLRNAWVSVPKRKKADIDDISTRSKYEDLAARVDDVIGSDNQEHMASMMKKIKTMRQSGLEQQGEFGADNLAFKLLRNNGYIKRLVDARNAARDRELSLAELARPQQRVQYGFMNESPDGVNPTTKMFLEQPEDENEITVRQFIDFVVDQLGINDLPEIVLHNDSAWSEQNHSFGRYTPEMHTLEVNLANRHIMDVLRTTAHELVHCKQNQEHALPDQAGDTGSDWENEANAMAGVIMRDYAEHNPRMFENASGYIPRNKKEARDPRYSMALTVDIKPGQVGKEANKLALNTGPNGEPQLLMKSANALRESIQDNLSEVDRRNALKALGAGAMTAAVPGIAKAGPFVDVTALGKSDPDQFNKVWVPRYKELTTRCQDIMRQLIAAAGPEWASLLKGSTIRVVSSENYAQASAISRTITIDLSVFWDAPAAALAFTIAHELGHIALEHATGTDDSTADYKTQVRVAAQYRQGELDADEFAVRICKVLGYSKAEVFKFIAKNEAELQMLDALTQSPTSSHPSQRTRIERARMNGFQLSKGGIQQMNMLKQHLAEHDTVHSDLVENLQQEFVLFEEQDLFEINMGSKNLRREAAKTGAIAGMEFEMIVPNVEGGDGDEDLEPDYDYDQSCRSIQDAYDFFYDGDWNSRRSCDEMRDSMRDDYTEWLDDKIATDWDRGGEEYILEWVKNNVDESEWNPEDLEDDARNEALEEYSANVHSDPVSDQYQTAYEEFREENQESYDESDWLDAEDLDLMSYVENRYNMSWPHYSSGSSGGEAEISDVAQEFENAIGRDVRASDNYHSGSVLRPSPTQIRYIVEPDGSLEPDDPNDQGLEFVSPPLPIDEILGDLNKVKKWAKEYGCYTNDSTGLHINISVPGYSRENLDFVKLALLMGDKYVLDAFGRTGNTYAKSALDIVKRHVRDNPEGAEALLDKMKGNLDQLASKAIHSGITSKYTSINTKDGHIEFRSPGGDWLDQNFDQIENTLLRFTVAMSAALNPDAYRQEYLTKLYKMLTENNRDDDTIKYFSDYVAGKIPKAALRSFVKQAQLQRNIKRGKTDGQKMWWKVYKYGRDIGRYGATVEVVATSEEEAKQKAAKEWGEPLIDAVLSQFTAKALRPYVEQPDKPGAPQTGTGTYELFDRRTGEAVPDTEFSARNQTDVNTRLDDYIDFGPHGIGTVDARLLFGARPVDDADQETLSNPLRPTGPGPWEVYNRQTGNSTVNLIQNGQPITDRAQAQRQAMALISTGRHDLYGVRTRGTSGMSNIGTQTDMENRLGLPSQSAAANYAVVDRFNTNPVFRFRADDQRDANRIYGEWLAAAGLPTTTEDYGFQEIRPEIPEVPMDVAQNFPQASSAPAGNSFSGQWRVMIDGEEVWRFRGVGNNQADANRIGQTWILDQIRQGSLSPVEGADVEVVPVMI